MNLLENILAIAKQQEVDSVAVRNETIDYLAYLSQPLTEEWVRALPYQVCFSNINSVEFCCTDDCGISFNFKHNNRVSIEQYNSDQTLLPHITTRGDLLMLLSSLGAEEQSK